MIMTNVLVAVAALIAVLYLAYAIKKNKGIPDSVSATAYAVNHKLTFTLALIAEAFLLLPAALENSADHSKFLAFIGMLGLGAVGMSPDYKNENKL